jgi:hypothetical protein
MNAIITLSIGEKREFTNQSHYTFKRYAEKIGVDFLVYDDIVIPSEYSSINCGRTDKAHKVYVKKIIAIHETLKKYNRILYLDDSCYISEDCPNLFSFVPENFMAMHNEGALEFIHGVWAESNKSVMNNNLPFIPRRNYFNSGIILASSCHKDIFSSDFAAHETFRKLFECNFVDQTYLNYIVNAQKIPYITLGQLFSKMYVFNNNRVEYADRNWHDIVNLVNTTHDFSFLNKDNTSPGKVNHAFIYHLTSMWSSKQRFEIFKKLSELNI